MNHFEAQRILTARAHAVLGLAPGAERQRLRHAYHCRMLEHHPDRHPGAEAGAQREAALINEAYGLLTGRLRKAELLHDETLAERVAGTPLAHIQGAPSYEEWVRDQFYDVSQHSIWPV